MTEKSLEERFEECRELAPNRDVFRKYLSIGELLIYTLMVIFLVIRHKIDSQRLSATNIALLLAWFVYEVLYIAFLFTHDRWLSMLTWIMSRSL